VYPAHRLPLSSRERGAAPQSGGVRSAPKPARSSAIVYQVPENHMQPPQQPDREHRTRVAFAQGFDPDRSSRKIIARSQETIARSRRRLAELDALLARSRASQPETHHDLDPPAER